MKKKSLIKIKKIILKELLNSDIDCEDKLELIINLCSFLNPKDYKENTKILKKEFETFNK